MDFLNQFGSFLVSNKVSKATLKNYLSDLRYFLSWYKQFYGEDFTPVKFDASTIESFKRQNSKLSQSSFDRHLSTLRKFSSYLKNDNYPNLNPFNTAPGPKRDDPWELRKIKDFMYVQGSSPLSIKNYMSDIKQFLAWADKVTLSESEWLVGKNIYERLNKNLVEEYKRRLGDLNFSPLSINRKLSSIRKLVAWAHQEKKISSDFLNNVPEFPFNARQSFSSLKKESTGSEPNPPKQKQAYSIIPPLRLTQISLAGAGKFFDLIIVDNIVRGLNLFDSLMQKNSNDSIFKPAISKILRMQDPLKISNISKSFYNPLNVSIKNLSLLQKILHTIRFYRPKWYLKYHTYPIVHYIHFAVLVIVMTVVGFAGYQRLFGPNMALLGTSTSIPPRVLNIKQKLYDSKGNPITSPSDVRFAIYDDPQASQSSLLWEEVNTIRPDENGSFSVSVGQKNQIPSEIFVSYPSLWLGLSVGQTPELKPRQQLSQVNYAGNAQTIQNMGIADTENYTNSILALDSTGNLSIGGDMPHTFQSLNSQFILSGNILTLSTVLGTNSNIEIIPDGLGKLDIQKPIQNSSNNNNLLTAMGSVEFDDNVSILATSSSQSAFTINQNDIGALISASAGGIAKFTVDNSGNTTLAGDINLSGNNPNIFSINLSSDLSIGTSGKGNLIFQPTSAGDIEFFSPLNTLSSTGTLRITGDLILATPSATTLGGIKYSWPTSGQANGYFLKTNGSGSLSWSPVPDLTTIWNQTGGNVGLGTTSPNFRLDVQDSQIATAAAQIFNTNASPTASGLNIKLGNASSTTELDNKWITFDQSGIGIVGTIKGNGSTGITFQGNGVADFAEYLKKDQSESIEYGMVVCLNTQGLVSPCNAGSDNIIGVTSKNPTFLGGENLGSSSIAVGLTGQVKTLVSNINGDIKAGDALTSSEIPGVAVKANRQSLMVGRAISKFDSSDCPFNPSQDFGLVSDSEKVCEGSIYIVLNVSHYEPTLAQKSEQLKNIVLLQTQNGVYEIKDGFGKTIARSDAFATAIIANLTAGAINAKQIIADSIDVGVIRIAGQNIKDYIADAINQSQIKSPIGSFNEIHTDVISPLSDKSGVIVRLPDKSSLTIENASQSAVVSIDSSGNASFSGQLSADNIQTSNINSDNLNSGNASISGVLRAGKIIADNIEGLKSTNYIDLASMSSQLAYVGNLRAITGNFSDGLVVQSPSTFLDISVFGQIEIDKSLVLAGSSINVLGSDLELQPLRQGGLSIMAGFIYVDTDGNVKFQGNAEFSEDVLVKGTLSANIISPLPEQNLTINIGDKNNSSFVIKNTASSSLLSVDQNGDLIASGSGTFNKLNLLFAKDAFAVSKTEVIATGSAGIATISAHQKELTINNNLVTDKSLIYVTPRIDTQNLVIYLLRQVPEVSFTIGINASLSKSIPFNWLIVN